MNWRTVFWMVPAAYPRGKDKKNRRLSFQLTFPWARRVMDNLQDLWFLGIVWNWKIVVFPKMLPALNAQSLMNCGNQLGEGNGGPLRTGWNPWQRSSVRKKMSNMLLACCCIAPWDKVPKSCTKHVVKVQHKTTRSALTPTQSQLGEFFPCFSHAPWCLQLCRRHPCCHPAPGLVFGAIRIFQVMSTMCWISESTKTPREGFRSHGCTPKSSKMRPV